MISKKIAAALILGTVFCTSVGVGYNQIFADINKQNVTLLKYTEARTVNKTESFKINSLSCGDAVGWLSNSEVLILNKKSEYSDPNISDVKYSYYYLSIYNINTEKTKEFKNTNVGDFGSDDEVIKISPDKKYVLYVEPKLIPHIGSTEWQKDLHSGNLFNRSVKILNLTTGDITDFKGEYRSREANYSWIDNNNLFVYYPNEGNKWSVQNVDGTVYKTGSYKALNYKSIAWPAYNLNIKVSGKDVSGNFIIKVDDPYIAGQDIKSTYYAVNVATNEMKQIYRTMGVSINYTVQNNVILIPDEDNSYQYTKLIYFNTEGVKLGEVKTTEFNRGNLENVYSISKNGKTVAFPAMVKSPKDTSVKVMVKDTSTCLDILDLSTGKLKKVYESKSLIKYFKWNDDGNSLIFNDGKQYILKIQ